jgi:CRISPR/Cas system-associated endonuclease Cas1
VVLSLVSRRAVTPADFTQDPDKGCRLSAQARNILVSALEKRMLQLVTHHSGRRMSYRVAMHMQAKSVAALVSAEGDYRPMLWK